MILKTGRSGELWVNADSHARPRRMGPGEDARVLGKQPGTGVSNREPAGVIRLDSSHAGGAGVLSPEEEGAWGDPRLPAQGESAESGSSDALDPAVPAGRHFVKRAPKPPPVSHHPHEGGLGTSGRNRPAPSPVEPDAATMP